MNNTGKLIGFIPDLMNELAARLHFQYAFTVMDRYGSKQQDGSWNGMINEVMLNEVRGSHVTIALLCICSWYKDMTLNPCFVLLSGFSFLLITLLASLESLE